MRRPFVIRHTPGAVTDRSGHNYVMFKNLKLSQQALILILVPLIFEIAFVTALGLQLREFEQLLQAVNKSRQFGAALNEFVDDIAQVTKIVDDIKTAEQHNQDISPEFLSDVK